TAAIQGSFDCFEKKPLDDHVAGHKEHPDYEVRNGRDVPQEHPNGNNQGYRSKGCANDQPHAHLSVEEHLLSKDVQREHGGKYQQCRQGDAPLVASDEHHQESYEHQHEDNILPPMELKEFNALFTDL